jgi:hypothetical protein
MYRLPHFRERTGPVWQTFAGAPTRSPMRRVIKTEIAGFAAHGGVD